MVRLDYLIRLGAALDDVGIYRTLSEEVDSVEFSRLFFEHSDKFRTYDLSLLLGIGDARELVEEPVHAVGIDKGRTQLFSEYLDDLFRLSLSQKAVVDVHADELLAYRLDQKRGDYRAVHAARKREKDLFVSYLFFKQFDLIVDKVLHIPVSLASASVEDERLEVRLFHRRALLRIVTEGDDGNPRLVYLVRDVYPDAVDDVVRSAV